MSYFDEYLADGESDPAWRPVVERLAERAPDWPLPDVPPDGFSVWSAQDAHGRPVPGLLIWADLPTAGHRTAVTLGARFDASGLSVGRLLPHDPGAGFLTAPEVLGHPGMPLAGQADAMLERFALVAAEERAHRDRENAARAERRS